MKENFNHLWFDDLRKYRGKFIIRGNDESYVKRLWDTAGVYFVWDESGLQYIGQSKNIYLRFESHSIVKRGERKWIIGVIPVADMRKRCALESYCIQRYQPPVNRLQIGFQSYPDPERDNRIVSLRREGKTYQAIGNIFGITRERVRQILARSQGD